VKNFSLLTKKLPEKVKKLTTTLLDYQVKLLLKDETTKVGYLLSDQENPSVYYKNMEPFAEKMLNAKKSVIYFNKDLIYFMIGDANLYNETQIKEICEKFKKPVKMEFKTEDGKIEKREVDVEIKYKIVTSIKGDKNKTVNILYIGATGHFNHVALEEWLKNQEGFNKI